MRRKKHALSYTRITGKRCKAQEKAHNTQCPSQKSLLVLLTGIGQTQAHFHLVFLSALELHKALVMQWSAHFSSTDPLLLPQVLLQAGDLGESRRPPTCLQIWQELQRLEDGRDRGWHVKHQLVASYQPEVLVEELETPVRPVWETV